GYQDFPRLSSFLAKDGYMPRWMQNRGDRLVYNGGIISLAVIASIVVVVFRADEIAMLPLYALGVMLSFTLSQTGMFRLMGRVAKLQPGETLKTKVTTIHYEKGTTWKRALNGIGAVVTLVVLVILIATKFMEGAWIVVLAIPVLVYGFRTMRRHYTAVSEHLSTKTFCTDEMREIADVVIVPVAGVHRGTLRALRYAKRLSNNVRAISICTNGDTKERLQEKWDQFPEVTRDIHLELVEYAYRDILTPLVDYILSFSEQEYPGQLTTVVIPEFMPERMTAQFLHNQTANLLRMRLRRNDTIVIVDVPYLVRG
ncbi:MAG: amino acid permease, partial [Anaerolineales bacterium]|nr:amino acid permease [Anaerolineales bacterium]